MKCGRELKDIDKMGFCLYCGEPIPKIKKEERKQMQETEEKDVQADNDNVQVREAKPVEDRQESEKHGKLREKREAEIATKEVAVTEDIKEIGARVKKISISGDDEILSEEEIEEFIDDEIIVDDPFSKEVIDAREEEEKASEDERVREAKEIIAEIAPNEDAASTMYPLASPNIRGYKSYFIGNEGTNKETAIKKVGEILYSLGKIKAKEALWINFGNMPDEFETDVLYVITDLSSAITWLFNLDDLSDESSHMQHKYKRHMETLLKAPSTAYIILNAEPGIIKGFRSLDPRIEFLFSRKIEFPDLKNGEIYELFYDALPEFHQKQLPGNYKDTFTEYLTRNRRFFPFNNKDLANFLAETSSRQPVFQLPKEKYNSNAMDEAFSSIIGMENVKNQARELALYLKARKEMEERGAKLPHFHLHMMFLGNPGVGKTTIARILAKLLFDLGYIREDKLIEVSSKDLVGAFGNQTGMKTNRVILRAIGGVLFVDEAYSLAKSCGQAGEEVIATLVKAMEDYKGDLVVMFAGYTLEMGDFVKVNSGIASRIAYTFQFKDYTVDELYQIYELKARLSGLTIAKDAKPEIRKIIEWGHTRKNFGNGRYIDKLLQRTLTKHATLNIPKKEMLTLRKESIPHVEEIMETFGRFLG